MKANELVASAKERLVAAVDLGSNSFHVTVARLTPSGLQILVRDRERVRLASGLGDDDMLSTEAIARGVDTLARFEARLQSVATEDIRAVGTHTLREASNSSEFLDRAAEVFRAPIEIISGPEEARLIFHAVAHTQPVEGPFLVFDIGGGSTEFAIGQDYAPSFLSSRSLGCVTYTNHFMQSVSSEAFAQVSLATKRALEPIAERIRALPFVTVFATSGTAKGVSALGVHLGFGPQITRESIAACQKFLSKESNRNLTNIPEVSVERMQVLPAGVGIMAAILEELALDQVVFADSALREGVLYTMDDRLRATDIRERTAVDLMGRYGIDREHAERVKTTAEQVFDQVADDWNLYEDDRHMLVWAAMLHETGLQINYSGFHRHGAYVIANTPLPGFNREQQSVLATLVRLHRKRFDVSVVPSLRYWSQSRMIRLIRILRLASVLRLARHDAPVPEFKATVSGEQLALAFASDALANDPVMALDLEDEMRRQADAGFALSVC